MIGNSLFSNYVLGDISTDLESPDIDYAFNARAVSMRLFPHGAVSRFPAAARVLFNDISLSFADAVTLTFVPNGKLHRNISGKVILATIEANGKLQPTKILTFDFVSLSLILDGTIVSYNENSNVIKWSNIGALDFTINDKNIAGQMPIAIKGFIYAIKKLRNDSKLIVYTNTQITMLSPVGIYFSPTVINNVGLLNKLAIAATPYGHYYINTKKELMFISDNVTKLGYKHYFNDSSYKLVYNKELSCIFILGIYQSYILSVPNNRLTKLSSPVYDVNGLNYVSTSLYRKDSNALLGYFDFGTRNVKTIYDVRTSHDEVDKIEIMVMFRLNKNSEFMPSTWIKFTPAGIAYTLCYGIDFLIWCNINNVIAPLSALDIRGKIHNYVPQIMEVSG